MSSEIRPGIFREVNERIAEITGMWHWEDKQGYLCECAATQCTESVWLTRGQYESIRATPGRFVLVPGHEPAQSARDPESHGDFVAVESVAETRLNLGALTPLVDAHR